MVNLHLLAGQIVPGVSWRDTSRYLLSKLAFIHFAEPVKKQQQQKRIKMKNRGPESTSTQTPERLWWTLEDEEPIFSSEKN